MLDDLRYALRLLWLIVSRADESKWDRLVADIRRDRDRRETGS